DGGQSRSHMELARSWIQVPYTLTIAAAEQIAQALTPIVCGTSARVLAGPLSKLMLELPDGREAPSWQEVRNKWAVIDAVENSPHEILPLESWVRNAFQGDSFFTLWVIEGIGQRYAEDRLAQSKSVDRLFQGRFGFPSGVWMMLHAGMGLAL